MPRSRTRKKNVYTPPPQLRPQAKKGPSARWVAPLMLTCFAVGIGWLVVYYLLPNLPLISSLGGWNLAVGFGFIVAGFAVSTQWR